MRGHIKTDEVLQKLAAGRAGMVQTCREANIGSDEYRAATSALTALDDLVEALTGNRRALQDDLPSTP